MISRLRPNRRLAGYGRYVVHSSTFDRKRTFRCPFSVPILVKPQLDRQSPTYRAAYKQRTATERINAQAQALDIEQPLLRNHQAIVNRNTLTYVLINLRALHRVRRQKAEQSL